MTPAGDPAPAPVPVDQLSYTEASRELDAIVDFFEQREVDVDVYARLIRELKRLGVDCVVDTDGDPLRRAVRAALDGKDGLH